MPYRRDALCARRRMALNARSLRYRDFVRNVGYSRRATLARGARNVDPMQTSGSVWPGTLRASHSPLSTGPSSFEQKSKKALTRGAFRKSRCVRRYMG